jgi:hypothetical protein
MALFCAIHSSSPVFANDDAEAIRSVIGATWDKPDSKVETDPIVMSHGYAVASWTQGAHGGRALLRRNGNGWSVVLCSGDPLKHAARLVGAGVPQADAERIADDLEAAEAQVPAERRGMFSLFEGVVSGEGADHHAPTEHERHTHP